MNRVVFLLFLLALAGSASSAPRGVPEAQSRPEAVVSSFIDYLLAPKTDIATDRVAQDRWLSARLKALLGKASASAGKLAKARPNDRIDLPGNGTFLMAWDRFTTYKIKSASQAAAGTEVLVECSWGPGTNYPNTSKDMIFTVAAENGALRINEVESLPSPWGYDKRTSVSRLLGELAAQ